MRKNLARMRVGIWIGSLTILVLLTASHTVFAETTSGDQATVYTTANFQVRYRTIADPGTCNPGDGTFQTWPAQAQTAMNHVIDTLDDLINSQVQIVIDACYQADPTGTDTLASASPNVFYTQADAPTLPVANRQYAVALANAISGVDQNGGDVEIVAIVNSNITWDFCTQNCTVANNRFDFVSTMIHELLHGLGYFTSFDPDDNDPPVIGFYTDPPAIMDDFIVRATDEVKLITLPNNSAQLMDAMRQGSGTIVYNGPNVLAANRNIRPSIFSPTTYSQGSSMSHWDDDDPANLGRMMNSASDSGPSSRVVDAITLMTLKDIGWSVTDPRDHGDSGLNVYGDAQHINDPSFVGFLRLGSAFSAENAAVADDASDDGVSHDGSWSAGTNGGTVTVTVASPVPSSRACLTGWIDWNLNSSFADFNETVIDMQPVVVGNQSFSFDIPASVTGNPTSTFYNARFRLIPDWNGNGACDDQIAVTPAGGVFGGEVEDYLWTLSSGGTTTFPPGSKTLYLPLLQTQ